MSSSPWPSRLRERVVFCSSRWTRRRSMRQGAGLNSLRENQLYQPETSITLGAEYLEYLAHMFPQLLEPVAASYNGGEDNVARWLERAKHKDPGVHCRNWLRRDQGLRAESDVKLSRLPPALHSRSYSTANPFGSGQKRPTRIFDISPSAPPRARESRSISIILTSFLTERPIPVAARLSRDASPRKSRLRG